MVGINLAKRWREVENLVLSRFGWMIRRNRWDKQDVIQTVLLDLCIRERGRCPWDPKRGTWARYVYLVAWGTIRRLHEHDRVHPREILGVRNVAQDLVDAGGTAVGDASDYLAALVEDVQRAIYRGASAELAERAVPMIVGGASDAELAAALKVGLAEAARLREVVQERVRRWAR